MAITSGGKVVASTRDCRHGRHLGRKSIWQYDASLESVSSSPTIEWPQAYETPKVQRGDSEIVRLVMVFTPVSTFPNRKVKSGGQENRGRGAC